MRLAVLFLRSRRAGTAVMVLAATAAVCWVLTWWLFSQTPYGAARGGLSLTLVFGSLAAACVVGASAGSPFGDAERTSARPLAPVRFLHLFGVLLAASLVLCCVLLPFDLTGARPEHPLLVLVRNVAVLGGLALLSARLFGVRPSWIPPFVLCIGYLTAAGPGSDVLSTFVNRSHDGLHAPSWIAALLLLVVGLGLVCARGARQTAGETHESP